MCQGVGLRLQVWCPPEDVVHCWKEKVRGDGKEREREGCGEQVPRPARALQEMLERVVGSKQVH